MKEVPEAQASSKEIKAAQGQVATYALFQAMWRDYTKDPFTLAMKSECVAEELAKVPNGLPPPFIKLANSMT